MFLSKCEVTADGPVVHPDVSKQVIGRWRDDRWLKFLACGIEPSMQATTLRRGGLCVASAFLGNTFPYIDGSNLAEEIWFPI